MKSLSFYCLFLLSCFPGLGLRSCFLDPLFVELLELIGYFGVLFDEVCCFATVLFKVVEFPVSVADELPVAASNCFSF